MKKIKQFFENMIETLKEEMSVGVVLAFIMLILVFCFVMWGMFHQDTTSHHVGQIYA